MIRLERSDLDDPRLLGQMAEAANMASEEFLETFSPVVS